jgi:glycosyltransferase involved in cell wall biosynthesis
MRVCIVYDCLFPFTVGGAERWYRELAEQLARDGHEVTYLTRRQWERGQEPAVPGVRVLAVSGRDELYGSDGNRRILPPLRFGAGVGRHLLGHRRRYDVVHTCAFPYFSLLAARVALAGAGVWIAVDWHEVWTRGYWTEYLGRLRGRIGYLVQRVCVLATPHAFVFSQLHARRLIEQGLRGQPQQLPGIYAGPLAPAAADRAAGGAGEPEGASAPPLVVFAGRQIPEKRAASVPAAIAAARERIPDLRGLILGDGPERRQVRAEIERLGLADAIEAPGFVSAAALQRALRGALCLLLPSVREGFGYVVVEAAAERTPSVVVAAPDNAAVELIEPGVNGYVAPAGDPDALAAAIVRVHEQGAALRDSTARWFAERAPSLTAAAAAATVSARYPSARS